MRTLTPSPLAVFVTAVGLALALSQVLGSQGGVGAPQGGVGTPSPEGCSMLFIDGYLVADNGRVVLLPSAGGPRVPLDWPDGWTVRPTDDGQLEVVDTTGTVRARTGAGIVLNAVNQPGGSGAWIRDGHMVVCPYQWPDNYMDPNYVPPDGDAGDAP